MKTFLLSVAVGVLAAGPAAFADDMLTGVRAIAADEGGTETYEFGRLTTGVMRMTPGERIDLNFGPGYELELDRIDVQPLGAQTWVGRIAGDGIHSRAIITEMNGTVFGRIQTDDGLWYMIPQGNGHVVMQIPEGVNRPYRINDTVQITPDILAAIPQEARDSVDSGQAVPVGSNGNLDLAVFYSQSFSGQWGMTSSARVQHLVAVLDTALVDSDTGMRARLVFNGPVTLTNDNADQAQTLANLSGITDPNEAPTITQDLSALRTVRQTHGADLIGIIQLAGNGHGGCGIANILGSPSTNGDINAASAAQGYSVTGDWLGGGGFCSDITYAHEVGHNLGMAHNVEDSGIGTGVRTFANGHREDCNFITIMSYPTSGGNCPQGAPRTIGNEQEAPHFSNPSINLCPNGAACGIAAPAGGDVSVVLTNDPADNARAAREESKDVTLFSPEAARVVSSVLPTTRSVQNGTTATAFATVINPNASGNTATGCGLRLGGATGAQFSYQTTTPANALSGAPNTPIDIAQGAAQNFLFSVTSATTFDDNTGLPQQSFNDERNLFVEAFCTNRRSAEFVLGLNTLTFTSSATAPADVIALAATIGNTGRVEVPTAGNQVGVFSVAVSNVGTSASITVSADTGGRTITGIGSFEICQTNPTTGACLAGRAATQTLTINQNETATFGIFVRGNGTAITNDPAQNRVFVRFNEGATARGATSVAVRTTP